MLKAIKHSKEKLYCTNRLYTLIYKHKEESRQNPLRQTNLFKEMWTFISRLFYLGQYHV